ncbi:MAG: hypothetical protein WC846_02805 [Candidatus Gracilibacteria bacterium]
MQKIVKNFEKLLMNDNVQKEKPSKYGHCGSYTFGVHERKIKKACREQAEYYWNCENGWKESEPMFTEITDHELVVHLSFEIFMGEVLQVVHGKNCGRL